MFTVLLHDKHNSDRNLLCRLEYNVSSARRVPPETHSGVCVQKHRGPGGDAAFAVQQSSAIFLLSYSLMDLQLEHEVKDLYPCKIAHGADQPNAVIQSLRKSYCCE
jgi:hypothetical protein